MTKRKNTVKVIDVISKAIELADANPDFIYTVPDGFDRCLYSHYDENGDAIPGEGCLFGQALAALGIEIPTDLDDKGIGSILRDRFPGWTGEQLLACVASQTAQDNGIAWGDAVEHLREYVTSLSKED